MSTSGVTTGSLQLDMVYNISMAISLIIEFRDSDISTQYGRTKIHHHRRKRRSHGDLPCLPQRQVM
jgi:hypothetical protein